VTYEAGGEPKHHTLTGVRLIDVLDEVGLAVDPEARNAMSAEDTMPAGLSAGVTIARRFRTNITDAPLMEPLAMAVSIWDRLAEAKTSARAPSASWVTSAWEPPKL
jgi:hypothetical protein